MVEIPSLYELACRAHSGTWMPGYQEAFDEAMSEGEKPCLILLRIASQVSEIPYGNERIPNTFMWRIAYMNEELFGLFGPLQRSHGEVSQVAVIEDYWEDCWGDELDEPELHVCRYHNLYGWDKDPYDESIRPYNDDRDRWARCLRAEEIVRIIEDLDYPNDRDRPLEDKWFDDAELPLRLVDGVPESIDHSERRGRNTVNGTYHGFAYYERDYLQDPNWLVCLEQALGRRNYEEEQMEE